MPKKTLTPLTERFWSKVDKRGPDECWPWLGSKNDTHYGQIQAGRRGEGHLRATRLSFDLAHPDAPLLPHEDACHTCDNPPCVNPAHLFRGTRQQNMQDAMAKGRLRGRKPPITHCKRGHEFTPANTRITYGRYGSEIRNCRRCRADAVMAKHREDWPAYLAYARMAKARRKARAKAEQGAA